MHIRRPGITRTLTHTRLIPLPDASRTQVGLRGNRWQVQFFDSGRNLHSVWDTPLIERAHNWTFSEWADEIDRAGRAEQAIIVKGSPDDWADETFNIATQVYNGTPVGSKLSYDYVSEWAPVVEQRLLFGGLRLAYILNGIYR